MGGAPRKPVRPTSLQLGLLVETKLGKQPGVNVQQLVADIAEPLDVDAFERAWQQAVDELDALRMTLRAGAHDGLEASFEPRATIRCRTVDWSAKTLDEQDELFAHYLAGDRQRGVSLEEAPAMHVRCLILGPAHWRLLWTFHQSLLDVPSTGLVLTRVFETYQALKVGRTALAQAAPSYQRYLESLGEQDQSRGRAFFANSLRGFSEPTPLPFERRNRAAKPPVAGQVGASLSQDQTAKLRAFAKEQGVSLKTIAELCWGLLLSRYAGKLDVVFGTTWSGRDDPGLRGQPMVGFTTNTTPLRLTVRRGERVHEALQRMHAQLSQVREFLHTPLPQIHADSSLPGISQLFRSVVATDHGTMTAQLERKIPGVVPQSIRQRELSGTPLLLSVHFEEDRMWVELAHAPGTLTHEQAVRVVEQYLRLVRNAVEQPDAEAATLRMLDDEVFHKLVTEQTQREDVPAAPSVIDEIAARAKETPDAIAVEPSEGKPLSYDELHRASAAVADALRRRKAKVAAIALPRSPGLIAAMLGAMRAQTTFVPVDPDYPRGRVKYLLEDSGVDLIVTDASTKPKLPEIEAPLIELDQVLGGSQSSGPTSAPNESGAGSGSLPAYIIYTSGSSGEPKGVAVSQSALANHCLAIRESFELQARDRVLQFASPSFDVALEEIFPTLAAGARLVLRDELSAVSVGDFFDRVEAKRISVLNLPTAFWHKLVDHKHGRPWPLCVRLLVVGGEKASQAIHRRFRKQQSAHIRWLNAYGPTEATITSTVYDDAEKDHEAELPIGRPIRGGSHFILDAEARLMPPGAVGRLHIGGAGLADGYLGRPEETGKAFISHPFRTSERVYDTGDLAFMTQRGNFVFVDREDNQLKIRGYRVEPSEVEAQLQALPEVSDAVVVPVYGKEVALSAHVMLREGELDADRLQTLLAERLPPYMVPTTYRQHASFPKTPSGKVDRNALAKRLARELRDSQIHRTSTGGFSSRLERTVSMIWRELLGAERVDVTHDFFEQGGSSLLLLELFSEIERRLNRKPNPQAFLKEPTLANLIQLLGHYSATEWASPIVRMAKGDDDVRPLFLAAGISGSASDFVHLVEALDQRIPVYALQIVRIGTDAETALRRYAQTCAADIKLIQPEGPIALAGYSAGSIFALAVAEALLEQGDTVDFLGVFDGTPPSSVPRKSPLSSPRRFLRLARTTSDRINELIANPKVLRDRIANAWVRSTALWRGKEFRHDVAELFDSGESDIPAETRALWQNNLDALMQYGHRELPLDIALFRTEVDPFEGPHAADLGWSAVVSGQICIETFPGRHFEFLTKDGAPTLATQLEPHLLCRTRQPA